MITPTRNTIRRILNKKQEHTHFITYTYSYVVFYSSVAAALLATVNAAAFIFASCSRGRICSHGSCHITLSGSLVHPRPCFNRFIAPPH